jgi:hypothetical protein
MAKPSSRQLAINALEDARDEERTPAQRRASLETARKAISLTNARYRSALEQTLEELTAALPEDAPSTAVEPASYHDVEGVDALIAKGVKQARRAADQGLKTADMARQIAETLFDARLRMTQKDGLPDIVAQSKFTKNIAHDMFTQARQGVSEDDVDRWQTHASLAKAVRNRMSDVLVARLRGLEESPEGFPAEALERAREAHPDLSDTEAVYALYADHDVELPRKGRTELAREQARAKTELMRRAAAGELTAAEVHDVESELEAVERFETSLIRHAHRAESLPSKDRAKVKARLNAAIAALAAEAAKL